MTETKTETGGGDEPMSHDRLMWMAERFQDGDEFRAELGPQRDEPEKFSGNTIYLRVKQPERYESWGSRVAHAITVSEEYRERADLDDPTHAIRRQIVDEGDTLAIQCHTGAPGREILSLEKLE